MKRRPLTVATISKSDSIGSRLSPEAFASFAELVPDGLALLSGEGKILAINRAASVWLGNPPKPVGRNLADIIQDEPAEIEAIVTSCRRTTAEVVCGFRVAGRDAPIRAFAHIAKRGEDLASCRIVLRMPEEDASINRFTVLNEKIAELGREIIRRKAAEKELLEQRDLAAFGRDVGIALAGRSDLSGMLEECAELIVKHLGGAFARIWTLEPEGQELVLRASAGMYTHLDGDHSRIKVGQFKIGMIAERQTPHLTNSVVGDERVHNQDWATREGMVAFAGYPLIVDGRTVGVMAMFARHKLSENRLTAMASVANSIALGVERIRIEERLLQTASTLKMADRRKDEFLAMLAHELRNPLAPIRSGIELLRLEGSDNDTLSLMDAQVRHLTRLVDDLLDVSRIMRGKIELRTESLQLNEIIEHAVQTVAESVQQQQHSMTVVKSETPLWLKADRVRLGQVLTNLLTNAVKYTPPGGSIRVHVDHEGGRAVVKVSDNGVGITREFLPQVFELFAQAERGLARSEGGLGIGLTLVDRLVKLHGGAISVHSGGPGLGTEFRVELPLAEEASVSEAPQDEPTEWQPPTECRVLVVDDSVGSAKILRRLLLKLGLEQVELAYDGHSALLAAESGQPDVIFLDIGLPGLTGIEVCERLRAKEQFQSTRLIALTGYGTAEDRRKTAEAGFDNHIVKPVGLDELKRSLV